MNLHENIRNRRSGRYYSGRSIAEEDIKTLLEAARWAASSFNEQPWRFIYASRDDETSFLKMQDIIMPGNRSWADNAGAYILSIAKMKLDRNEKANRHAYHDVGLAVGNLSAQATSMGINLHQMGGFDYDRAVNELNIPDGYEPVAMIALGKLKEEMTSEELEAESKPRSRLELDEIAFKGSFRQS